jgi:two-component system OmpR family sensor kinase
MRTIRQQLLLWLIGGTLLCSTIAGSALYLRVSDEANELFDAELKLAAESSPATVSACYEPDSGEGPEELVIVQAWNSAGALVYSCSANQALPRFGKDGFHSMTIDAEPWRVYGTTRSGVFVQAAQPMEVRDHLAAKIARRSLLPFVVLIPVLALFTWFVVGRSLQPIARLARAVGDRSAKALQPLAEDGLPPEIAPVVVALNDLLKQLDHALAMQRAFVADAAHELRTPLTALKLQLQLAENASGEEQRAAAFLKLHDRLDRATRMVGQLLTLARHEAHDPVDHAGQVDLHLLAQEIVSDFYLIAERKSIDLGVDSVATPQIIRADGDGLRIVLSNLVDNAIRYTPNGGRVDIGITVVDGCPALIVADNGPGIPEQDRARVFDRFYRGEQTQAWGSGLGLAIVRNIADIHGASIRLSGTSGDGGLTVTVLFPPASACGRNDPAVRPV